MVCVSGSLSFSHIYQYLYIYTYTYVGSVNVFINIYIYRSFCVWECVCEPVTEILLIVVVTTSPSDG